MGYPTTRAHEVRHEHGFTLIELMLVATVMALLVTLAAPSYKSFLTRAHRTTAMAQLMQAAACQERTRSTLGNYDTDQCLPQGSERYRFAYTPTDDSRYYQIEAEPLGLQQQDRCGKLTINSMGRRSAVQSNASIPNCWSGR